MQNELQKLSPLANLIVEQAIDNTNLKLVASFRNKNDFRPSPKSPNIGPVINGLLAAASAKSAIEIENRGAIRREVVRKVLSRRILSLSAMRFDRKLTTENSYANGLDVTSNNPVAYPCQSLPKIIYFACSVSANRN